MSKKYLPISPIEASALAVYLHNTIQFTDDATQNTLRPLIDRLHSGLVDKTGPTTVTNSQSGPVNGNSVQCGNVEGGVFLDGSRQQRGY